MFTKYMKANVCVRVTPKWFLKMLESPPYILSFKPLCDGINFDLVSLLFLVRAVY